jgi:hypothetical protein
MPPEMACAIVQSARPHIAASNARLLVEGLTAPDAGATPGGGGGR